MKKIFQNTIDSLHLFLEIGLEQRHLMKKKEFWLDTSFVWSLAFVAGVFGSLFAQLVDHWYPILIAGLPGVVFSLFELFELFEGPHPRPKPAREAYTEYLARRQEKKRQRDSSRNPEK